jgi:Ca2+/Na+ antiporter
MSAPVIIIGSILVLAACCYLLNLICEPLEDVGGRIGQLLKLPEDVIASTFQALATSGPEITMAVLAATTFVEKEWGSGEAAIHMSEKASSGTLNMCFSAMDNLLGIGCVGIIFMIYLRKMEKDEVLRVGSAGIVGLVFYIGAASYLAFSIMDGYMSPTEAWILLSVGIVFIISQFFVPGMLRKRKAEKAAAEGKPIAEDEDEDNDECEDCGVTVAEAAKFCPACGAGQEEEPLPDTATEWALDLTKNLFFFSCLVFGLVIFVQYCMSATFHLGTLGIVSVGGILLLLTSYVSSFPEFFMTYRFCIAGKKDALLGMLFGSNVIDLAFSGWRAVRLGEGFTVKTTGRYPELLPYYIGALPVVAVLALFGLTTGKIKAKHAYVAVGFYMVYVVSGFFLL